MFLVNVYVRTVYIFFSHRYTDYCVMWITGRARDPVGFREPLWRLQRKRFKRQCCPLVGTTSMWNMFYLTVIE